MSSIENILKLKLLMRRKEPAGGNIAFILHWFDLLFSAMFFLLVEDLESHDGSAERPYYMSKSLLKILNKQHI